MHVRVCVKRESVIQSKRERISVREKLLYGMFPTEQGSQHKQEVLPAGIWACPNSSKLLKNTSVRPTVYL